MMTEAGLLTYKARHSSDVELHKLCSLCLPWRQFNRLVLHYCPALSLRRMRLPSNEYL